MTARMNFPPSLILLILSYLHVDVTGTFVAPKALVSLVKTSPTTESLSCLHSLPPPLLDTNEQVLVPLSSSALDSTSTILSDGIAGTLTTIASVIAIIVFAFGALLLIMANIVIPQAAKELEEKARKEYPQEWAACEAKLEEGEVLAMRPDLIQELGRQVQEGDLKKFETMAKKEEENVDGSSERADVIDVEVITKQEDK